MKCQNLNQAPLAPGASITFSSCKFVQFFHLFLFEIIFRRISSISFIEQEVIVRSDIPQMSSRK
ncbi:hypothetical protein BGV40_16725 [Methanosarcina sp. Ant1]|nr:hypothetical protein BGV40_16725 [Methanosarcina sp. Ant1]